MKYLVMLFAFSLSCFAQDPFKFSNESALSLVQTGGNTQVETYDVKTENFYKRTKDEVNLGGHYLMGHTVIKEDGDELKKETARNWDFHAKYIHNFSPMLGAFIGAKYESDVFAGYERRNNYDLGGRLTFLKTEVYETFLELGYRYTEEYAVDAGKDDALMDNKGRAYYELSYKPSAEQSYRFWVEYVPNFTRSKDYLLTSGPSITSTLSNIFSLQIAYLIIYDNDPAIEGNKYTDTKLSTALVAKF